MAVVAVPVRSPVKLRAVIIPDAFTLPSMSKVSVGCVDPIPTFPFKYTKSDALSKRPLLEWYGIVLRFPGAVKSVTVILIVAIPVCSASVNPTGSTVTPLPTKLNLLKLFANPTWISLLYTLKEPGIRPVERSDVGIQYLFPNSFWLAIKTYLFPEIGAGFTPIEDGPTSGSPKSGSAWSNPKNSYRSDVRPICGFFLTLLLINPKLAIYLLLIWGFKNACNKLNLCWTITYTSTNCDIITCFKNQSST